MKIKPIFNEKKTLTNRFKNILNQIQLKSKEYEYESDPDLIELKDKDIVPEVEPTCSHAKDLVEYIREQVISRKIKYIVIHCTATRQDATVSAILNYWKNKLGWKSPGYHIIYTPTNGFTVLSDFNKMTNGVYGHNSNSIHLSYIGGIDKNNKPFDNRTPDQNALIDLTIKELLKKLPNVEIKGHTDFPNVSKNCPSFDVSKEF